MDTRHRERERKLRSRYYRKIKKRRQIYLLLITTLCCLILLLITTISKHIDKKYIVKDSNIPNANNTVNNFPPSTDALEREFYSYATNATMTFATNEEWFMTLVNKENPLYSELDFEKIDLDNGQVIAAAIYEPLMEMLAAGERKGLSFVVCSGYRSYEEQVELFSAEIDNWMAEGYSYQDAYNKTQKSVTPPGTSEHQLGLAVDIVAESYQLLDEIQATTLEAIWLAENCYKYGFILRYPPGKTHITTIIYEPWHFRYVGVEHATLIMNSGITFEEYWNNQ